MLSCQQQQHILHFSQMTDILNRGPVIRPSIDRKIPSKIAPSKTKEEQLMSIMTDVMKTLIELNQSDKKKEVSNIYQRRDIINPDFEDPADRIYPENRNQDGKERTIRFSNEKTLQKSKYGEQYKLRLDPRDQLLAHPFTFEVTIPSKPEQQQEGKRLLFMNSESFQQLCENIEEYLVDVVQNIVSVSFNLLIENKLKENQSKDYASKNLLLNVQSIFREIMETLVRLGLVDKKQEKKLRYALTELVDSSLNQILSNLSPYYPQAPPTGGTPRMRQALISIDRNSNEELDFLITQNLKLKKEDNGDYTQYIMEVINRAIQITGQIDPNDAYQLTMYERFVAFSENLFWISQEDSYSKVLHLAEQETANNHTNKQINIYDVGNQKESSFKPDGQMEEVGQLPQRSYCSIFGNESLENRPQHKQYDFNHQDIKKEEIQLKDVKKLIAAYMKKPVFEECSKATLLPGSDSSKDKKIEEMRKRHDFAIGQKIPSSVKSFSKKDIKDKNFSAKNSTVLRILTKWAQNLEGIFDNPQNMTLNRIYPFKTLTHDLVFPTKDLKQKLYKQISEQKQKKQKMKEYLITRNKVFQSTFFSKQTKTNITKYIKRYTETRVMASKMNALLIQFMKQYVSGLIHLLVEAGKTSIQYTEGQFTIAKQYDISLVIFKIGDLMRSKIHCNEASFIRLLKTMYILEQTDDNKKPLFQLVRIKNKLDSQDNNILINYLFMGKLQCELQMSVQNIAGKEMHYYSFSHFLYELTRGQFGVLSECATIVAQYDPIVSSSKFALHYEPKKPKKRNRQKKIEEKLENIDQKDEKIYETKAAMKEEKKDNKIFVCRKCGNLKFDENIDFLKRQQGQKQFCNDCLLENITKDSETGEDKMVESKLNNDERSAWLIECLNKEQIKKLKNYDNLQSEDEAHIICHFNPKKNDIELSLYSHEMSQDIYFISRLSKEHWETQQINIESVTYQNITSLIDKSVAVSEFTYYFQLNDKILAQLLKKHKKINIQVFITKLRKIQTQCKRRILLDSITTVFKNKNQTLLFNSNNTKLDLINHLVTEQMSNRKSTIRESFSHIQFIFAEEMNIEQVPPWLNMCNKMKVINFSNNNIKDISILENMKDLKEVILRNNEIKSINWSGLTDLERLNLSDNKLDFFHMECLPQNLVEIDVGYNKLKFLNLDYLPRTLKKLDLFGNELVNLDLKELHSGLQHIDLSYNKLEHLNFFKLPSALSVLFLNENQLTHFELQDMPNLVDFYISSNKLISLSISNCPKLKQLHCDQNLLTKIEFDDFPQVVELSIGNNPLKSIKLTNFPLIQTLQMVEINPNDDLQIKLENLNTDTIKFKGSSTMLSYLQKNYNDLKFIEANDAVENSEDFEYNDSADEDE